ncbi:MAG TPA: hypothetical protein PK683_03785, partial [Leptospiraceae bacterium]|nr:hypothetical protein [Leptospiraceae bacterium]
MLKKIIPTLLFLLSCSVYSIDNVLVDELEYLGASEESWMAVGIRNSIINDLSGIGGKYDLNIITVKEQTEAMQSLNERRKTG